MNTVKKLVFFLWLLAAVLVAPPLLRSFGLNPKEVVKDLFSDKPRKDVIAPVLPKPVEPVSSQEDERGHARELRPNISVPPARKAEPVKSVEDTAAMTPDEKEFNEMISGLENIAGMASAKAPEEEIDDLPVQAYRPANAAQKVRWLPPPPGFSTADTFNYLIYREKNPVTSTIKTVLDNIHGNLMLDLTPFTIIIKPNKILVMLFGEKDSYIKYTKRPAWSGASSDLRADTMYVIESDSFYPLSVHELTHLYFDGYFLPAISPLWLSEGMAVYMQIYATKQKPSWVDGSLRNILAGRYIPLENMMDTDDLSNLTTEQAEIWYTQAYSLVDYLLNERSRDEFYQFCNELKSGAPVHQALYRAYGMPFTKVSVLQNVWLHDLSKHMADHQKTNARVPASVISSTQTISVPASSRPRQQPAAAKSAPQKTVIPKLKKVQTNAFRGGF